MAQYPADVPGYARVADLGAASGAIRWPLAQVAPHVVAVAAGPGQARLAAANVAAAGLAESVDVICADWTRWRCVDAAFVDPRALGGGRRFSIFRRWTRRDSDPGPVERIPHVAVKAGQA